MSNQVSPQERNAAVKRTLAKFALGSEAMVRSCVVRSPYDRALSGFRYLCRSDDGASEWFPKIRLRLNAFDFGWLTMPNTERGFVAFLAVVAHETEAYGASAVNDHRRTQVSFINLAAYVPTLTGRIEALGDYFAELGERLGVPSADSARYHDNRQSFVRTLLRSPAIRRRIAMLYEDDSRAFGS